MTDQPKFNYKSVSLDEETRQIIEQTAQARRLGPQGFSLALRQIVQEWHEARPPLEPAQVIQPHSRQLRSPGY